MTDSSPEAAEIETGEVETEADQDAPPAESSTAEGVKSLHEIVDDVLGTGSEESPASESGAEETSSKPRQESDEAKKSDDQEAEGPKDPTDEELKTYSANAQDRIRELVSRRKEVESRVAELEGEAETLRPQAEQTARLNEFLQRNRIGPDEFQNVVGIAALIQTGQYDKALEIVTPIYRQLLDVSGNILPADLQEEVRLGYITEKRAHELQRERATARNAQDRETRAAEDTARQRQDRQNAELVDTLAKTGDAWHTEKATSDPDWSLKQDLVTDQVETALHRLKATPDQIPRTEADVRKFLDEQLRIVENRLKPFKPTPQNVRSNTGKPASQASRPKPESYMDAINQALDTTP